MASAFLITCVLVLCLSGVIQASTVCYQPYGCFSSDGTAVKTPQSPTVVNTNYKLYNRQHRHTPYRDLGGLWWQLKLADFAAHFDGKKKTKVLIHGFLDTGNTAWIANVRDALLNKGDFNVMVVDWGSGSKWPYEQATGNSFLVGAELSLLLQYLSGHSHVDPADVHIIGHSLGAQVAGHAGKLHGSIGRISALDPADPGFSGKPIDRRLDATDAGFVDVIHTDGSFFNVVSGYGTKEAIGDIDFFPNGGEHQPGCSEKPAGSALSGILHGAFGSAVGSLTCSHSRAHEYFLESLTSSCKFYAHKCSSLSDFDSGRCVGCPAGGCPMMGFDADKTRATGSYFLATSTSSKFCGKEYLVEVDVSHALKTTYGELFITLIGTKAASEQLKFTKLMRQYHADDVERHVIASHTDIGDVTQVKVKFVRGNDLHALGAAHDIQIRSVTVEPLEHPQQRKTFCGHNAHIQEQASFTLHSQSGC